MSIGKNLQALRNTPPGVTGLCQQAIEPLLQPSTAMLLARAILAEVHRAQREIERKDADGRAKTLALVARDNAIYELCKNALQHQDELITHLQHELQGIVDLQPRAELWPLGKVTVSAGEGPVKP